MMDFRAHVGSDPVHPESRVWLLHCPSVREAMAAARSGGATRIAWLLVAVTAHFLAALNGVLARYLQASLRASLFSVCDGCRRAVCAEGSPFPPSCRLWQSLPHLLPAWPPSPACCRWPRCCASMLRRCWPSRCGGASCSAAQRAQQRQVKAAATALGSGQQGQHSTAGRAALMRPHCQMKRRPRRQQQAPRVLRVSSSSLPQEPICGTRPQPTARPCQCSAACRPVLRR